MNPSFRSGIWHERGRGTPSGRAILLLLGLGILATAAAWCAGPQVEEPPGEDLSALSLEQLMEVEVETVYGASRYLQKATEAPASVSIITAEEIRRWGYRTLADILNGIRGLSTTYDRNYTHLGVRGFSRLADYNNRILLLIDGHRINDCIFGQAPIGTEGALDVDLIDRLEFVRGPSSCIYGSNAFFGVINILTRTPAQAASGEISMEGGSLGTVQGRITGVDKSSDGTRALVSATLYDSDGQARLYYPEYDDPETNNGLAQGVDHDHAAWLFAKLMWGEWRLSGLLSRRAKQVPTGAFDTIFNDPGTRTWDDNSYLDLSGRHVFPTGADLSGRLYLHRYDYRGTYIYDYADPGEPLERVPQFDYAKGIWWGGELLLKQPYGKRHILTAGGEYRYNVREDQTSWDQISDTPFLQDRRKGQNWGAYLQGEFRLGEQWLLNVGTRYDRYDTFGGTTNPRLALIHLASPGTVWKLLYGQAFRAPTPYELYYHDGGLATKPNPGLQPELIRTLELAYERLVKGPPGLRPTVAGFLYQLEDLINQESDPADGLLIFRNRGGAEAAGLELEGEARWPSGLKGRASCVFQRARDRDTDRRLTNSPLYLARLQALAPLAQERGWVGLEWQYTGSRRTLAGDRLGGHWVANLTLSRETLLPGAEVALSVYNLFDRRYADPGSGEHRQDALGQDGRRLRMQVTYRF